MPASIFVRDMDDDMMQRLRRRAASHGRSEEAEARAFLSEALVVDDAGASWDQRTEALRARLAGRDYGRFGPATPHAGSQCA